MTVGELKRRLEGVPDDTPVENSFGEPISGAYIDRPSDPDDLCVFVITIR